MPAIAHLHSRLIEAPPSRVRPALDALWSGRPGDAFPFEEIRPWRRLAPGASGFSLGTRFGHGPYRFVVDSCDERKISAQLETPGYVGSHCFQLIEEQGRTRVVHELRASVELAQWMIWKALVGPGHDWAVKSCLARLEGIVCSKAPESFEVPASLRAFIALRTLTARLATVKPS